MAAKSLYDLLEVSPGASNEAIEAAFRRLVDALKPRAAGGEEAAIVQLQALHEAHRTLTDPVRRERYDRAVAVRTMADSVPAEAEESPGPLRWLIPVALVALLVAGGGWYHAHKSQVERQRAEAALREKAEELARLEAERERQESSSAARAARDAARQQRAEELQYQRWVEKNRRDADRIQQQNAYAERRAQAEEARAARRLESERLREVRQRELEQQREDTAAMRRLEEEKRRLRELQRANGTY